MSDPVRKEDGVLASGRLQHQLPPLVDEVMAGTCSPAMSAPAGKARLTTDTSARTAPSRLPTGTRGVGTGRTR